MALDEGAWPSRADFPDLVEIAVLARGAHATVFRARQLSTGRNVALKVDARVLDSPGHRQRFEQEALALTALSRHEGIVDILASGITETGQPYTLTELCRGSYARVLAERGPLIPSEVRRIGMRVATALAFAHENRVRHGDIKPANILITMDGDPVLADFGVASLLAEHQAGPVSRTAATPAYAPLETFHMQPSGEPGDVYSLAATLYALLSGRPPRFPVDGPEPTLDQVIALCNEPIPDIPGVSQVMLGMLRAAMTNNPTGRPSAAQFRDMLESVPVTEAIPIPPDASRPPTSPATPPRIFTPEPATTVLRQRRGPSRPDEDEPVTAVISSAVPGHRPAGPIAPPGTGPIETATTSGAIPQPIRPAPPASPPPTGPIATATTSGAIPQPIRPGTGPIPRVEPTTPPTGPIATATTSGAIPQPIRPGPPRIDEPTAVIRPTTGMIPRIEEPPRSSPYPDDAATTVIRPGTGGFPHADEAATTVIRPGTGVHPRAEEPATTVIRPGGGASPPPAWPAAPHGDEPTAVVRQRPPEPSMYASPPRPEGPTDGWDRPPAPAAPLGPWGQPQQSSDDDRLPVLAPKAELPTRRERRLAERGGEERSGLPMLIGICAGVLLLIVAGIVGAVNLLSGDEPDKEPKQATPAEECSVEKYGVSCLPDPRCFADAKFTDGDGFANAAEVDCTEPHVWEAYAVGELTTEIDKPTYQAVSTTPEVQQSCLDKTQGGPIWTLLGAVASDWATEVLPPTPEQFENGDMTFLCIARLADSTPMDNSVFG